MYVGSGGGTSGRALGLGRPGLNPRTNLGFFQLRTAVNLFSLGVRLFSNNVYDYCARTPETTGPYSHQGFGRY